MNCDDALAAFATHLDGEELSAAEAETLDGHLAECAACRTQAAGLAGTHRDLLVLRVTERARPQRAAAATEGRIQPATVRRPEPPRQHSRWVEAAAAAVLAAVLVVLIWPFIGSTPTATNRQVGQQPKIRVGQVTATQGRVEGRTARSPRPASLVIGAELVAGQEIRVPRDGFAELDLQDGVLVRLESLSVLRFGTPDEPGEVMLLRGRGRFEVTARDAPWRLQTPKATVSSRGGKFKVVVPE